MSPAKQARGDSGKEPKPWEKPGSVGGGGGGGGVAVLIWIDETSSSIQSNLCVISVK